jgi:hypothetical protein
VLLVGVQCCTDWMCGEHAGPLALVRTEPGRMEFCGGGMLLLNHPTVDEAKVPTTYNPHELACYWRQRPEAVSVRLQQILGVCGELLPSLTWDLINGNVCPASLTRPGRSVLGMRSKASVHMLGLRIVPPRHYVGHRYDRTRGWATLFKTLKSQPRLSHCCHPPSSWGILGSVFAVATNSHEPVVVIFSKCFCSRDKFVEPSGSHRAQTNGTRAAGRQGESGAVHGRADGNAHHAGSGIHQIRPDTVVARGPLLR